MRDEKIKKEGIGRQEQEHAVAMRRRKKKGTANNSETRPMCERGYVNNILKNWNGIYTHYVRMSNSQVENEKKTSYGVKRISISPFTTCGKSHNALKIHNGCKKAEDSISSFLLHLSHNNCCAICHKVMWLKRDVV